MCLNTGAELKSGEPFLDCPTTKRMPLGTARGLEYLHGQCNPRIIDRDVKETNILLDGDFEVVVGDFGDCNGLQAIGMSFVNVLGISHFLST